VAILPADLEVQQLPNARQNGRQSEFDKIIKNDLELLAPFDSYAVSCPLQFFAADAYDV
jgi:hypothetical protein